MEDQNMNKEQQERWDMWEKSHRRGKIATGFFIVALGFLFLARELGAVIPHWLVSWKTILIAIGVIIGIKSAFRNWFWIVPVFIGSAFIFSDLYPEMNIRPFLWPTALILVGSAMIFKPHRKWDPNRWSKWHHHRYGKHWGGKKWEDWCDAKTVESGDDHIDSTTVMGGIKKKVISKNFKGGEITNIMGGSEYDLSQADINGSVTLEITQFFGGTKLIIPSHWEVKSELTAVLGGIEDNRPHWFVWVCYPLFLQEPQ